MVTGLLHRAVVNVQTAILLKAYQNSRARKDSMVEHRALIEGVMGYPGTAAPGIGAMCDASKRLRDEELSEPPSERSEVNFATSEPYFKHVNSRIIIPDGMTLEQGSHTLCKMDKVINNWNPKGLSYRALVERAKVDGDISGYLTWVRNAWGTKGTGILPKKKKVTPAVDLAMFLECVGWVAAENSSSSAFVREFVG